MACVFFPRKAGADKDEEEEAFKGTHHDDGVVGGMVKDFMIRWSMARGFIVAPRVD